VMAVLALALPMFGQGAGTTGRLTGTVTTDNAGLPGVTVTISSPALQGRRTAYTDVNGNYTFGALPPGRYTVTFEMESMQTVTRTAEVPLSGTARADASMRLTAVAEAITVTASAPAVLETTEVQTNIDARLVEELPIGRTLIATTTLAPGVNSNGPNVGAITISGALAADNLFLVNGAVVNENLRGQPHALFIEDAIQETTVQTAGISAEYGRFMGGVVSAITKSGGNEFTGSFRDSFQNDKWTKNNKFVSPFTGLPQPDAASKLNETYEGTLGGFILRDRLWFFTAGRYFEVDQDRNLFRSNETYNYSREQLRLEGKLTAALTQRHTLIGSYLEVQDDEFNNCFIACYEPSNIDTARSLPNDFMVLGYNGIFTDRFLVEANYSQKNFAFEDSGGDSRDLVTGSWAYDWNTGAFFGAPVFCGVCDPEERNNSTYGVKATYYLATRNLGTHNIVAGYENWAEERIANNYQSGSNFHFGVYTSPTRAADGSLLVTINPGDYIGYNPIDVLSKGSDFVTDSVFVNNKWDLNQNFSFNVGVRYDMNDGKDSSGRTVADDSFFSPRLGLIYDLQGNGRYRVNASYSKYVNRIAETIGGSSSAAGNPAGFYYEYLGPAIGPLPTFDAFQQAFNWFNSVGGINNFDLLFHVDLPGVNVQIPNSLKSPNVDEFTVGFGSQLGQTGFFRVDLIDREFNDFFVRRTDIGTGKVSDAFGNQFDLVFVENSDILERSYQAVQLQAGFRPWTRLNVGGNYTWSETKGNQTGQTGGSGPIADDILRYPEYRAFARNNPSGFLPQDQTHKVRAWVGYDQPTPIGNFNISVLQNFDSGTPYSAAGLIDVRPYVTNPGYLTVPASQTYYFSNRGEFRWDDITSTDVALNYTLPIGPVQLFLQGNMFNIFNEKGQIGGDTTIRTNRNANCLQGANGPTPGTRCLAFDPFTTAPVEGVHWQKGPLFGQPTTATTWSTRGSFQLPRTYLFSAGLRF
jgi:outer membrane receptor protein involved in Fe transport